MNSYLSHAGLLQHVTPALVKFTLAQIIILQFNLSTSHASKYIASYNWFHNDSCLDCVISGKYKFDLNNTRMTIFNATDSDAGIYEVRVTSFKDEEGNILQDKNCIESLQANIKYYAAYGAVIYHLIIESNH